MHVNIDGKVKLFLYKALDTNLVRLGGAGAVFPRLLVVLRICTPAVAGLIENVLSFELEPASAARGRLIWDEIETCTIYHITRNRSDDRFMLRSWLSTHLWLLAHLRRKLNGLCSTL